MSEMRGILRTRTAPSPKAAGVYFGILILDFRLKRGLSLTLFAGCSQVRNAGDRVFKPLFANYALFARY
jgi:hypothetical protein